MDGSEWPVDDMRKSMKTLTNGLARVDAVRLPGCGPRDTTKRRIGTVGGVAQCHS